MASSFAASRRFTPALSTPHPRRRNQLTHRSCFKCQHHHSSSSALFKTLSTTAISAAAFHADHLRSLILDFTGGNAGSSGGGNGGVGGKEGWFSGDEGSFWSRLFLSPAQAIADESNSQDWVSHGLPANIVVHVSHLRPSKKYKISEIVFFDRDRKEKLGTDHAYYELLSLRPGVTCTKAQLLKEVQSLMSSGWFKKVDMEGRTNADGSLSLMIAFKEEIWEPPERFRCINVGWLREHKAEERDPDMTVKEEVEYAIRHQSNYKMWMKKASPCLLPVAVHEEITDMFRSQGRLTGSLLKRIEDRVDKWYHDEGYAMAKVARFKNLDMKELVCEVVEGEITRLEVQFLDKLGNVVEGNTQVPVVLRTLPKRLRPGYTFEEEVRKQAIENLLYLPLFSDVEILLLPDMKHEALGAVAVEVKLKEKDQKSFNVDYEWRIIRGEGGVPSLASLEPGGDVTFEYKNLKGLNRTLCGSVKTSSLFNPQGDLKFKIQYVHPYWDGIDNPKDRTLGVSVFNTRKVSPVFTGGPGLEDDVPRVFVERAGIKANITKNFTRQSKYTWGLVMEHITMRDDIANQICTHGQRLFSIDGPGRPPTTLSGTGIDWMAFLQSNLTRDNTKSVNGGVVGSRNVVQVDQGLGIGRNFPFFNRHKLTITKFFQLMSVEEGAGKPPPPVLVLHGVYGGCVGDLPTYDAFTLGGPYSIRGCRMGEIGTARNILELAVELRIPIKGKYVYAFAEHGNDLGSSRNVTSNPTEYYGKTGQGSSYGVGLKLGSLRVEYAVDHNKGTGDVFVHFGERF